MERTNLGRPAAKVQVELSPEEQAESKTLAEGSGESSEKAKFLLLLASGEYTRPELMEKTKKNRQQILNFILRFNKYRMDAIKKKYIFSKEPMRHAKMSREAVAKLLETAQRSPKELGYDFDDWTLLKLATHLHQTEQITLTRERIRQILMKNGVQHHTKRQMPSTQSKPEPAQPKE